MSQPTLAEQMQPYIERGEVVYNKENNCYALVMKHSVWETPAPITLERAVEILNEHKHRGIANWISSCTDDGQLLACNNWKQEVADGTEIIDVRMNMLFSFEAICIAEGYQRLDQQVEKLSADMRPDSAEQ